MLTAAVLQGSARPGLSVARRVRVLVVDDSVVIRRFVSRVLAEDPDFEVVGFAVNGAVALEQAAKLLPDAITMDIEMPELDGLATVRRLRQGGSKAVIIMCSTLTLRGAATTIDALMAGANDYVTKPAHDSTHAALEGLRLELLPKIKQFFQKPRVFAQIAAAPTPAPGQISALLPRVTASLAAPAFCQVVAIGVSTGGPAALMELLPQLPASFPVPIVVVQHMPPVFTRQLADRLNSESKVEVLEAAPGMALAPGRVILAPGDHHMHVRRQGQDVVIALDQGERENSCRPAVDVLFRSVAEIYGRAALAVILTGMGQDGLRGVEQLKTRSAYVIAQDRLSSVVWGMPGAVVEAGLADTVLSLKEIVPAMMRKVPKL
jgi:two-component system chemotaxis response regulator CheB